jgi:hypothetical protein
LIVSNDKRTRRLVLNEQFVCLLFISLWLSDNAIPDKLHSRDTVGGTTALYV